MILLHELTYTFEFISGIIESFNVTAIDGFAGEDGLEEADGFVVVVVSSGVIGVIDVVGETHLEGLYK